MSNTKSILDKDIPRPTIHKEDYITPVLILMAITILILATFFISISYSVVTSPTVTIGAVLEDCLPDECATNRFTGQKRCPQVGEVTQVNPAMEVCNPPFSCANAVTPFALQPDNSTNISGVCPPGTQCRCMQFQQCPEYILSYFKTQNGSPYLNTAGQRIAFIQSNNYQNAAGDNNNVPPIVIRDPTTEFCSIPLEWTLRSIPGCPVGATLNLQFIEDCMSGQSSGIEPCLLGTLAYLAPDPDLFTTGQINTTPLACVRGEPCPPGQIAIWNNNLGSVVCKTLT